MVVRTALSKLHLNEGKNRLFHRLGTPLPVDPPDQRERMFTYRQQRTLILSLWGPILIYPRYSVIVHIRLSVRGRLPKDNHRQPRPKNTIEHWLQLKFFSSFAPPPKYLIRSSIVRRKKLQRSKTLLDMVHLKQNILLVAQIARWGRPKIQTIENAPRPFDECKDRGT